jgi:hypothetical protein
MVAGAFPIHSRKRRTNPRDCRTLRTSQVAVVVAGDTIAVDTATKKGKKGDAGLNKRVMNPAVACLARASASVCQ